MLLPCTVLLLLYRSFTKAAVPQGLLQHSSVRKSQPMPVQVSPLAAVWVCAPTWSLPRDAKEHLLWSPEHLLPPSHMLALTLLFSYFFFPFLLMLPYNVLTSLKYAFTEVPRAWLKGSVVSCGWSAVQPAVFGIGQSHTSSHRGHPWLLTLWLTSSMSSGFWDVRAVKPVLAVWLYLLSVCSYENMGKRRKMKNIFKGWRE